METRTAPVDTLTPEQRATIETALASPIKFPSEFKQWLNDYLATNIPPIPVSQLLGYKATLAHNEIINTEDLLNSSDFAERTWGDAPNYGPAVSGLSDGTYFVAWGCKTGRGATGGVTTRIGISINGADPTGVNYAEFSATDPDAMITKAGVFVAKNGTDNNEIHCMYYFDGGGGFEAQFLHRWLTVMRVS